MTTAISKYSLIKFAALCFCVNLSIGCRADMFSGGASGRKKGAPGVTGAETPVIGPDGKQYPPGTTFGPNGEPIVPGGPGSPTLNNGSTPPGVATTGKPPGTGGVGNDDGSAGLLKVPLMVQYGRDSGSDMDDVVAASLVWSVLGEGKTTEIARFSNGAEAGPNAIPAICTCGKVNDYELLVSVNGLSTNVQSLVRSQNLLASKSPPGDGASDWKDWLKDKAKVPSGNSTAWYVGGFDHRFLGGGSDCPYGGATFQCTESKWNNADDMMLTVYCKISDCGDKAPGTDIRFKEL